MEIEEEIQIEKKIIEEDSEENGEGEKGEKEAGIVEEKN